MSTKPGFNRVELPEGDWRLILDTLSERPYKIVCPTIDRMLLELNKAPEPEAPGRRRRSSKARGAEQAPE